MIKAEIILDSISPDGQRLTTMYVQFHRFILAEFNTHRRFSRNFRSSRAVPVHKMIEEVRTSPAEPVEWLKNKPGMQGGIPMTTDEIELARKIWRDGANDAADQAEDLAATELHKQWANRPLETYLYAHGVVTSTEWMNFFGLRLDKNAQPEMRALAEAMWAAYQASLPRLLQPGQWHLPFGNDYGQDLEIAKKVSVARCARVSYTSNETGKPSNTVEDLKLYERLLTGGHWSPFEHQATPGYWEHQHEFGNFEGWRQFRKMLPGEAVAPLPKEYAGCNDPRRCRNMLGVGEDRFGMSFACKVCDKTYYLDLTKDRA